MLKADSVAFMSHTGPHAAWAVASIPVGFKGVDSNVLLFTGQSTSLTKLYLFSPPIF